MAIRSYRGLCRSDGIQTLLQRVELRLDLVREPVAEPCQVLLDLRQLLAELVDIDLEQMIQGIVGELEPFDVDVLGLRDEADCALGRLEFTVAPPADPVEHAAVLAESRPNEVAVRVL